MRRLLVVVALLALMIGVKTLQAPTLASALDPLTLATIGFVLLASFTLAESGAVLRLPRVTGYILGGALLGPSVSNLLDVGVVGEMRMFNTLALGLIALSAGLELDVRQIAKVWRTLVATIAFKVVFLIVLVGGGLVLFERGYPSLGLASEQHVYAMALVFSALAIGTSPSVTLAVLSELRAKGRPADLFLGAAVLKDLVVVVGLAVAVALAKPLLGAQAASDSGGLGAVALELGGSILAGAVLGGLLVAYVRFVKAEMLLFVAAMILVGAELSSALHLELLLVFIAAGFVVRNFSKYGHDLMAPVSLVALPVFVVFFTNAGASIDIERTLGLLPIALTLCALRAVGLWGAAGLGARVGGEAEPFRRHVWLGYVPQAGVTLGLVALATQQLPELAEEIAGLGMAVVAVNLLVGPLTLRVALGKLGVGTAPVAQRTSVVRLPRERRGQGGAEPAEADGSGALLDSWTRELGPLQLGAEIRSLWLDLLEVTASHRLALTERAERLATPLSSALSAGLSEHGLEHARGVVAAIAWPRAAEVSEIARTAFRRMRERLCALPGEVLDPLHPSQLLPRRGDSLWLELRRKWRRVAMLFSKRARQRRIALQMAARVALEPSLAGWASQQLAEYVQLRVALMRALERYLHGQCAGPEVLAELERLVGSWPQRAESTSRDVLRAGTTELVSICGQADLPGADPGSLRLSRHDASIVEHVNALERDPPLWQRILDDLDCELQLEFELAQAKAAFLVAFSEQTSGPAERAWARVDEVLAAAERELKRQAVELATDVAPVAGAESAWHGPVDRELLGEIEEDVARWRAASTLQRLALQLRGVAARLPESIDLLWSEVALAELAEPAGVRFRKLAPRAIASEQLVDRLLPRLEEHLELAAGGWDAALETLHEIHSLTSQAPAQSDRALLERAQERAVAARASLSVLRQQFPAETRASIEQAFAAAATRLSHRGQRSLQQEATTVLSRSWLAFGSVAFQWRKRLGGWAQSVVSTLTRVGDFELARHFRERLARGALDGATIASAVRSLRELPQVPASYATLFSPQPVREPRLFCVREPELRSVLEAERRSLSGQPSSVLIIGAHGSGRTSLLNVAQLALRAPRVLRPQPGQAQRRGELLRALALDLDCRPDPRSLGAALAQAHTTVLVDDLEHWFEPTLTGAERLEEFVRLVSATRDTACFVVALSMGAFQIFREIVPLQTALTRHVQLAPLGNADLRKLIETRHRLSGMALDFHSEFGLRWLRRLGSGREAALFFGLLRRMTNGNLAFALRAFLSSAEVVEGRVRVRTEHPLSVGLSFLEQLETQQLAALNQALRFGGVDEGCLGGAPELSSGAELHLAFLQAAGLLVPDGPRRRLLSIPADLRPIVEQALAHRGAGSGREA